MANTYTISDLAKEFDLTTRAIRFYEDMGLLEPERSGPGGRNRVYSHRDRTRLKLTLRAKRLGLSLTEAKDLIDMYDSHATPCPSSRSSCWCWPNTASSSKRSWPSCRPHLTRSRRTRKKPAPCWPRPARRLEWHLEDHLAFELLFELTFT